MGDILPFTRQGLVETMTLAPATPPELREREIPAFLERMWAEISSDGGFDRIEAANANLPAAGVRMRHFFTPGPKKGMPNIYGRECFMPSGSIVTTARHLTEHQFIVSQGDCFVCTENGVERVTAPKHGITMPGTRRILLTLADTTWTTFHATFDTDPDRIIEEISEIHLNPNLSEDFRPVCLSR